MNSGVLILTAIFTALVLGCSSSSKAPRKVINHPGSGTTLRYTSSQLALKNLDEMNRLVVLRIRAAKSGQTDAVGSLREALRIIYARPNEDFMTEKLIGDVRNELMDMDEWENSITDLAHESIASVQSPGSMSPALQLSYIIVLENLLADFKPYVGEAWVREWITDVRDSQLEPSREARNERAIRMMKEVVSPSETAADILSPPKSDN